MKNQVLIFLLGTLFLVSCNQRTKTLDEISSLQMSMDSIFSTTEKLSSEQTMKLNQLIDTYQGFVKDYPQDSLSPKFLFEVSRLQLMEPDFPAALKTLDTIYSIYPLSTEAPAAITTAAAICENILKDCRKAVEYLQLLKEKYPEYPTAVNIDLQIEYVCDPEGYLNKVTGNVLKEDSLFMVSDSIQ